ncbi:MAG: ACP S-malonyltransferase [Calditerrivibrio sp.]|nr:ACP S-malonyltransferase [Calditerrivibrio sp.]
MGKIAVVFPGQGSQYVGMGKDLFDQYKECRRFFEKADELIGYSLSRIMFEGPEDELKITYNTQPALLTVSVAVWELVKDKINADLFAGHSLGEYSAVVAAGGMSFEDAVLAVHNRGKFMQSAVPVGVGAMAAVLSMDENIILETCREISKDGFVVEPANFNSDAQLVVAGHAEAVDLFIEKIKEKGGRKVIKLPVSAPFHCSLMKPAEEKMAEYLQKVRITDLRTPIYSNVEASKEISSDEVRLNLIKQVSAPVRWTDLVRNMIKDGVDTFVEVGAGNVLTGLIKKIDKNVRCFNIGKVEDIATLGGLNV